LPTIDEAIAAMSQEEMRLSLEKANEKVVPAPTFAVIEHREWRERLGTISLVGSERVDGLT
jgi:hypothetical protein